MKLKILPAYNGDCFLLSYSKINILIDGGPPRAYQRFVKSEISEIFSKNESLDLLIITHIDDDHIGGIINFFSDETMDLNNVKQVWFNHPSLLGKIYSFPKYSLISTNHKELSFRQGETLKKHLRKLNIWRLEYLISTITPMYFIGAKFFILSPRKNDLEKLFEVWPPKEDVNLNLSGSYLNQGTNSLKNLVNAKFTEDSSLTNKSSIAFIIFVEKINILFLSDSHPSVIVNSLINLGYSKSNKLFVNYMLVAHHGSKLNTNLELLSLITCQNFIISADGKNDLTPSKECLAKLIASQDKSCLYFTHKSDLITKMFDETDYTNYKFSIKYLADNDDPYTINLSE